MHRGDGPGANPSHASVRTAGTRSCPGMLYGIQAREEYRSIQLASESQRRVLSGMAVFSSSQRRYPKPELVLGVNRDDSRRHHTPPRPRDMAWRQRFDSVETCNVAPYEAGAKKGHARGAVRPVSMLVGQVNTSIHRCPHELPADRQGLQPLGPPGPPALGARCAWSRRAPSLK